MGYSFITSHKPLIFAANFKTGMALKSLKSLLVLAFIVLLCTLTQNSFAQEKKGFDANEVIFAHVMDAHEFHFFSYKGNDGQMHPVTIPLPVILYSKDRGVSFFMASRFHHGEGDYKGYRLLTNDEISSLKLDINKYRADEIVAVNSNGNIDTSVKVYDLSPTRNVVQMLIALILLIIIMVKIARKYKTGIGVTTAPKGMQNLIEPVITFVRDEIAMPNLGHHYKKYFPYLLTVFFFILINNLLGLIPGSANVSGNIAFTGVLAVISLIAILISSKKHYWGHIFWPPVPLFVKVVLIPVEILGIFTKPFALMIRLFANMIAGHIVIISLISLIFIFGALNSYVGWGFSPLSVLFVVFIYLIEVLIAFLQAYIFAILTAVFIGQAFEGSDHDIIGNEDALIV